MNAYKQKLIGYAKDASFSWYFQWNEVHSINIVAQIIFSSVLSINWHGSRMICESKVLSCIQINRSRVERIAAMYIPSSEIYLRQVAHICIHWNHLWTFDSSALQLLSFLKFFISYWWEYVPWFFKTTLAICNILKFCQVAKWNASFGILMSKHVSQKRRRAQKISEDPFPNASIKLTTLRFHRFHKIPALRPTTASSTTRSCGTGEKLRLHFHLRWNKTLVGGYFS